MADEGGNDIQTITISEFNDGEDASAPGKDAVSLFIEDLNFDGFADIRLQALFPAGSNVPYICWLWDDGARQFVHNAELSAIPSIEVDTEGDPEVSVRYPSPDSMSYVRELGNPMRSDVTFEVFDETGEIPAVRG